MTIPTPGQTIGPFFGYALPYAGGPDLVPPATAGAIRLHGRVLDGAGDPVPDAVLEIWQPDAAGRPVAEPGSLRRDGWTFTGWGRAATAADGTYSFSTVRPGAVDGGAPFFAVVVFARGLLDRLFTRAYLPDDEAALTADPLLAALPADRRPTLVTTADDQGYRFDVVLQGEHETVFLDHAASNPLPPDRSGGGGR
ncbi:protocatechuate 3,4-dioxygenase subunit alpha [uncultured Jatrophihabitans sp.]|uniref:protocatechuate 3,4-dioxygenase subunit alpha n=1 Tax=uncultured Jatrophihabitans sp. TaxID=1610747 RepID=UPI0035C9D490